MRDGRDIHPSRFRSRWGAGVSTLGLYHIVVGVFGVVATMDYAPAVVSRLGPAARGQALLLFAGVAGAFGLVAVAGFLLLRRRAFAVPLIAFLQVAQIPLWSWGHSQYSFFAGLHAGCIWSPDGLWPLLGWKAGLHLGWASVTDSFLGVNVVPIVILVLLRGALIGGNLTESVSATGDASA